MNLKEDVKELLMNYATLVHMKDVEYAFLPYWFKISGDTVELISLENLPINLIDTIEHERQ